MDSVEKIKSILDGLTQPLYKDDPFGTGGRKAVFDDTSNETQSLTFQAFVNRINTFQPEHWGSDPNAAVYLAKYGFKTVSGCRVCCCSCHIEVDMEIFLGKADVLQTIAAKSHKKSCRWLSVSTPGDYFKIPSNPHRTLGELKITFRDMMSIGPALPMVQKKTFVTMGLSEEFVNAVLSSFNSPVTDTVASALVLSLCGWIKSSDKRLQCNFCQRVVGTWNFFSVHNDHLEASPPVKKRRVISLLYNEIRRDMIPNDLVEEAESEKMDEDPLSESIQEPVEQLQNDNDVESGETDEIECPSEQNSSGIPSSFFAHILKKKALKYLRSKSLREERYFSKVIKIKMQKRMANYLSEDQTTDLPKDLPTSELDVGEDKPELDNDCKEHSDVSNNSASDNTVNKQLHIDSICNDNGASSNNGFCAVQQGRSEESCVPSVQSCVSSHKLNSFNEDECNVPEDTNEVKSSSNTNDSPDVDLHSESARSEEIKCSQCLSENSNKCISHDDCDTQMETTNCDNFENHSSVNNVCESPLNKSNLSEKSSDPSAVNHDESFGHSEGRKKRKRVPESERNGTPYDSELLPHLPAQLEPAHFTRSKKKELEMLLSERTKPKLESTNDNGENVVDGEISEDCLADSVMQTTLNQENMKNAVYNDLVNTDTNDMQNTGQNSLIITNHDDENTELTLVISSVRGNAVTPVDTSEEDGENECTQDKDNFTGDTATVSCKNEVPQDHVAEEGRNLENGYVATCHTFSDTPKNEHECEKMSSDDSKKQSQGIVLDPPSVMSCERRDSEEKEYDNVQTPGHKRKREETDDSNNPVIKKLNFEELNVDLCKSYFHPELEHRYWCIWRIKLADYLGASKDPKKGWEHYVETIKKGLELMHSEKISLRQAESKTLSYIADVLAISRQRK